MKPKNKWIKASAKQLKKYDDDVYNMIKKTYSPIGGFPGINSKSDINLSKAKFWGLEDIDSDPEPDVVLVSKNKPAGKKFMLAATDQTSKAKKELIITLIKKLKSANNYAELSGKPAEIVIKAGIKPIDNEEIVKKVLKGKKINWLGNGFYVRDIKGQTHKKQLFGRPNIKEAIDYKEFPNPLKNKKGFLTKGMRDGEKSDDVVNTKKINISASKLKLSQEAIYLGKALTLAIMGISGGWLGSVISKDNYILDGHHRYAATMLNNPNAKIGGIQSDLEIKELIPVLRSVGDAFGNDRGNTVLSKDINIFKSTIKDVIDYVYNEKYSNSYYNKEAAIKWFEKIGQKEIEKRLKLIKSKLPPSNAPKRNNMPKIKVNQLNIVKALLNKGKIDVREPYTNESINETPVNTGLSDKVYAKYKNIIDKLVKSVAKEFHLSPTIISGIIEKAIQKKYGHKFKSHNEVKLPDTKLNELIDFELKNIIKEIKQK